jgi:hypothetical protein
MNIAIIGNTSNYKLYIYNNISNDILQNNYIICKNNEIADKIWYGIQNNIQVIILCKTIYEIPLYYLKLINFFYVKNLDVHSYCVLKKNIHCLIPYKYLNNNVFISRKEHYIIKKIDILIKNFNNLTI